MSNCLVLSVCRAGECAELDGPWQDFRRRVKLCGGVQKAETRQVGVCVDMACEQPIIACHRQILRGNPKIELASPPTCLRSNCGERA